MIEKRLKGLPADCRWYPGPEVVSILLRIAKVAEKHGAVKTVKDDQRLNYVVFDDRLVKPIDLWRTARLVMDGKTDAPESCARRAKEAFRLGDGSVLSEADCVFILKEWSNDTWRRAM